MQESEVRKTFISSVQSVLRNQPERVVSEDEKIRVPEPIIAEPIPEPLAVATPSTSTPEIPPVITANPKKQDESIQSAQYRQVMATLVFDIETVGEEWGMLDETTQQILSRWIVHTVRNSDERDAQLTDLKEGLGFSPLTGMIVAIGLYDVERRQGVVYYQGDETTPDYEVGEFLIKCRNEKEMLEDFWEGAKAYDTFVTFNGRGFDVPFLNLRSAIQEIRPTQDLMDGRYLYQQKSARHVDLQDQMTFYGAMHKRPSLHLFCRAFGIESPKEGGVAGDDVAKLFSEKKFRDIAEYNARDVMATTELYKKWLSYLAPKSFLERLD